jgi:hypothetical protein
MKFVLGMIFASALSTQNIYCFDDGHCNDPRVGAIRVGAGWMFCLTSDEVPRDLKGNLILSPATPRCVPPVS